MGLINLGLDGRSYFKILPEDWQEVIESVWDDYKNNATVYVFKDDLEISAGGIVFRTAPPNMTDFEIEEWQKYVTANFHYIGFLFVDTKYRGKSLGSEWLTALKDQFPDQSYWLTIEEEGLRSFYEKNGFKCVSTSRDKANPEWILIYQPEKGK
ncbi:GNAT family N-acetyltransferase [Arenibacter echinorum]|uniref:Acetyltransferase (GNAT) family protein n=1 Tax=Arenibacter echinorum TaxID=440515 RepID=A0A327QY11_9FLAO|nr:GNAT family N-acetyltransferase [Arenibacter echinorum]RAJ09271.1 acetyltransferase (GNAT) family protein [Arenibacter echinorum]